MSQGVKALATMMILQVAVSCIYVLHTHEKLIFADRIAPKFVFDTMRSLIVMGFSVFWIVVDS